jgi:hypothetical protein
MTITLVGIPSAEALGSPTVQAVQYWWNSEYVYRYQVTVTASLTALPAGHPVEVLLDSELVDNSKLRSDFADLEVVQSLNTSDRWRWVGREVTQDGSVVKVRFPLGEDISLGSAQTYYIHFGNPSPEIDRPSFFYDPFPIGVDPDQLGVAYTQPLQEWRDGSTETSGAIATFEFAGVTLSARAQGGPDGGIAEVQFDDDPWSFVDTFAPDEEVVYLALLSDLQPDFHKFRVRFTGRANPSSQGRILEVLGFSYSGVLDVTVENEEVYANLWGGGGLGGV